MPLTASNQHYKESSGNNVLARRLLAGVEALILAFVVYIASGVQEQKLAMARMQATAEATNHVVSAVPALTIRVVEAEKDIQENKSNIEEVRQDVKDLKTRQRLE